MSAKTLTSLYGHPSGTILRDVSYDILTRLVQAGLATWDLTGGVEQVRPTINTRATFQEQQLFVPDNALDPDSGSSPVTAVTGPGGVVRKSLGLAVGELGVGSVIYARRQHDGYLPADGAVYSIAAYPALRATIGTAPDGAGTWTARTSAADNAWRSVCWSPELSLFCAIAISGTGNRVMTSPDGINWTVRASAADNNWYSVCWSPELSIFCAVAASGTGNRVMTSPDGVTWTSRASAADNAWFSVCWSPELSIFCAVAISGVGNRVMTSPDGINWTARASAADNAWYAVCWSPELSLFCAVSADGVGNRVMTNAPALTYNPSTHFKLPTLPNATSGEARAFIYAGA